MLGLNAVFKDHYSAELAGRLSFEVILTKAAMFMIFSVACCIYLLAQKKALEGANL